MAIVPATCLQRFATKEPDDDYGCEAGVSLRLGVCLECPRGKAPAPIQNEAEYDAALEEICRLFHATEGPAFRRLNALVYHVGVYEDIHYPIGSECK